MTSFVGVVFTSVFQRFQMTWFVGVVFTIMFQRFQMSFLVQTLAAFSSLLPAALFQQVSEFRRREGGVSGGGEGGEGGGG